MPRLSLLAVASVFFASTAYADQPTLRFEQDGGGWLQGMVQSAVTGETVSGFSVDADGNELDNPAVVAPLLRLGVKADTGLRWKQLNLVAEYEHDVITGAFNEDDSLAGTGLPRSTAVHNEIRKAYLRATINRQVFVGAGLMTSHWGLGLVANDGTKVWQPGSARFTDPRGGDRVLRGFAGVGLSRKLGMMITVAADSVVGDDILLNDDDASQLVGALRVGVGKRHGGGLYVVRRSQQAADGPELDVWAIDATARPAFSIGSGSLDLTTEIVAITGTTTLAPTMEYPEHDVTQLAAAARASLNMGSWGTVIDALFATGDANFDDGTQAAFKADPRYEMGLLMFRHVLAGQTGRGVATASNLDLVGMPSPDIDRFATRGSVSNTIAVFPRGWLRPAAGLEIYGGPLIALAATDVADPFNSRLNGGTPRNALDGNPGRYLGTEFDLGARYRHDMGGARILTVGVEGGVLIPGSALRDAEGNAMGSVFGARLMLNYSM